MVSENVSGDIAPDSSSSILPINEEANVVVQETTPHKGEDH